MNSTRSSIAFLGICSALLLSQANLARSADYSVTVYNDTYKITRNNGDTCQPVSLTYWPTSGSGAKVTLPNALGSSPQTLTVKNAGSCSSLDITVNCHYFNTVYTNKGKLSETSYSHWVDESKTKSFGCCHTASIGVSFVTSSNITYQVLDISCQ